MNALKRVLAKVFKDNFKPYTAETGEKLPNRAEFTGDKPVSKTGDPAKVELTDWHEGQSKFNKFRGSEKKDDYTSLVATPEGRQETMKETETTANSHKWFKKFADLLDAPSDESLSTEMPRDIAGVGLPQDPPKQNTVAKKRNWHEVLAYAAPDVSFKNKPDGAFELSVTHPAGNSDEQISDTTPAAQAAPQNNSAATTTPDIQSPTPENNTAISYLKKEACAEANDVHEWVIRKEGNLTLLGRECKDKAGIFILRFPDGILTKAANLQNKLSFAIDKEIVEKNGHSWQELINSSVWQTKFDNLIKQKNNVRT